MKALVTGATGFIGSVLTRELIKQGHRVRALILPNEDTAGLEKLKVELHRGDLTRFESLHGVCDGIDTVFHLAGRVTDWGTRQQFYDAIYTATENLLIEAVSRVERFVYISSIAAMGLGRHLKGVKETEEPRKSGIPYNDAKADTEKLVRKFHATGKISCTIVRPANVTGPGSVWVRDIVDRMVSSPVPLIDQGLYSTSFVYVDNLAQGIILAGTKDIAKGKAYHLRDNWDVIWKDYISDLGSFVGKKPIGNVPFGLAWGLAQVLDAALTPLRIRPPLTRLAVSVMGRDNDVDTSLARSELGWETVVPYQEALKTIGVWIEENYRQR
jgi:nucleoside-diphosphate-sugar epimerase